MDGFSIKEGVELRGMSQYIWDAVYVAKEIYRKHGLHLTITSGLEGVHSSTSLHYVGLAVDLRTSNIQSRDHAIQITEEIREALGSDYQVIYESNHIHIEYDPRLKRRNKYLTQS